MNCKDMQNMILTDYLDGEMDDKCHKQVEDHLLRCAHCREFEKTARQDVFNPLVQSEKIRPPEYMWTRIKESIEEKENKSGIPSFLEGFKENVRSLFPKLTPAYAFPAFMIAIFIMVVGNIFFMNQPLSKNPSLVDYASNGQVEYWIDFNNDEVMEYSADFGTKIEQYFL